MQGLSIDIDIDVPDLAAAERFYTVAPRLTRARRFGDDIVELSGSDAPVYLIRKPAGSVGGPVDDGVRRYDRHWTPVHPDFIVDDLDAAILQEIRAGAVQEDETLGLSYGRQAMFADPFGNGFCLIAFDAQGYDAIAT